jgi:hypothetical protein
MSNMRPDGQFTVPGVHQITFEKNFEPISLFGNAMISQGAFSIATASPS